MIGIIGAMEEEVSQLIEAQRAPRCLVGVIITILIKNEPFITSTTPIVITPGLAD